MSLQPSYTLRKIHNLHMVHAHTIPGRVQHACILAAACLDPQHNTAESPDRMHDHSALNGRLDWLETNTVTHALLCANWFLCHPRPPHACQLCCRHCTTAHVWGGVGACA